MIKAAVFAEMFGFGNHHTKLSVLQETMNSFPWQLHFNSVCLREQISIIMMFLFLGFLVLHSAPKIFTFLNRRKAEPNDEGLDSYHMIRAKSSIIYKSTLICTTLAVGAHLMMLLTLLNRNYSRCDSTLEAFLSEIMQISFFVITVILLYKVPKKNQPKFPGILRVWWVCYFLIAAACTMLDTLHLVTNRESVRGRDFANFFNLLLSTWLLSISIYGKTGITFSNQNGSMREPLLGQKVSASKESPYGKATLSQLVTFSWLNPLFALGSKKTLEQDEIPDVDLKDSSAHNSHSFDECIKYVGARDGTTNPSIYKAIFFFIWKKAAINAVFAVVSASVSYVGPYLIDDFVTFLTQKQSRSLESGYLLALAFLGAKMVETITQRQWIFGARQLGLRLRAALISHIYKKGLVLSSRSRQIRTSGEIINYMSVDIQRITDFMWFVNMLWMLPIQISLAMYILHRNLGLGSVAAFGATMIVMACNIPITRTQKGFQSKIMEAKDNRMKSTAEILRNMKTIKLQAWDNQFLQRLENLRKIEYDWLWKSAKLAAFTAFVFWGSPTFISITTFVACLGMGIDLTAGRVLSALATFRMLQDPIFGLPDLLNVIAQGKVSADRIASYLQEEEIREQDIEYVPRHQAQFDIEILNGKFNWDSESCCPTLDSVELRVKRGMKVAVCGTVGSGKSSLLSSVLGEMKKLSGEVKISGSKAYVPQSPWIMSGNIRDNIVFGNPFDSNMYDKTIKACALLKDFELFSAGDLTEIGERGINMSGGQKQRIQIARAVYQNADIYLLDDPFSAVDAHTGTQLFQDCLMGILKEKTVLFVTHQVEFLPAADLILVMRDGRIAQAGTFEELMKQNTGFELLVGAHNEALESILTIETSSRPSQDLTTPDEDSVEEPSELSYMKQDSEHSLFEEIPDKKGKLVQDEEREKGQIGKEIYWAYISVVKRGGMVPFIIMAQSMFQILQIASNYWMAWASPTTTEAKPAHDMKFILSIYIVLAVVSSLCVLVRASLVAVAGLWTAQKLFMNMLRSIMRAPMAFFDSTPTGRILNRASTDQSVLDMEIAQKLGWCAFSIIQLLGTIAVMSQVAWEVFVIFIPVTAICIWYQRYYIPTARELARLAGIQRAPILHHFAESLAGAATIRAFDQGNRFTVANLKLIDNHSRPWFHNVSAMEWLSFRLNILSNFVFAFSLILLVSLPEGIINPSIAGLAVTYGINLNVLQASVIWQICNAENKMISVERILQYSNVTSEAALIVENNRPPSNWPEFGSISFQNLQIRYAEHLPSVLKDITCTFPGKRKIGVVGRTGSGKSTLIQAIFRIVDPRKGTIIIDGVDICKIGLHDLRSRLSIIPQDPTMFEGTVRGNLDPLGQYSDNDIWEALNKCQLSDLVRAKAEKLDSIVVENGENWSVGQRQLFCLGRALLKKSSILVLDEATASVDSATDGVIQKIISQEFNNRTVVTIAHRIHTVIDSDLVLVLSDGRIAEYDSPSKLLEREDSFFSKLIKEYSVRSHSFSNLAVQ